MSFRPASQARAYIGILGAHAYARSASASAPVDMLDTTVFANTDGTDMTARQFIPGTDTATFQVSGPLDTDPAANGQYDAISDIKGSTTNTPITFLPLGTDGAGWLLDGIETAIDTQASPSTTVDYSFSAQISGQVDTNGVVLSNNTAITSDTDGSTVDNGAATTQGAVAHLHVTAFSGLTSDAIIIEASTTGAFAGEETTLVTFTTATGLTSQRVVVTGTIPRYLRVADDVTGTGSITRTVAISRR
jgi:hypothetical protein